MDVKDLLKFIEKRRAFLKVDDESPTFQGYLLALQHLEEYINMMQKIRGQNEEEV